ncbi:MAG: ABC transporter ATP-binding protein [Lachnospiraceae bacterium]|nr:ABC transporter ATP-binding protein [Lachnospiraceae bacterium]
MENIIELKNVGMCFNLSKEKVDSLKEYFIKLVKKELHYSEFWALKDVNLTVKKGQRLGVLGLNGAGKSTLLKVISGVFRPTTGSINVNGVIAPMIELGAGFDMQYTGAENIYLYGAVLGYPRKLMDEKFDEIVEFSELGDFIDVPLKNYSSGMKVRLGFAIATIVKPDVLILDEVLSVGDAKFKKKSEKKILSMIEGGTTVLFVSHNADQIKRICDTAIILEHGRLIADGPVDEVLAQYKKMSE